MRNILCAHRTDISNISNISMLMHQHVCVCMCGCITVGSDSMLCFTYFKFSYFISLLLRWYYVCEWHCTVPQCIAICAIRCCRGQKPLTSHSENGLALTRIHAEHKQLVSLNQSTIHMGASDGSLSMRHYVRLEWARQTVRTTGFECVTTKLTVIVAAYTHSAYRNRRARDFCCCLFNNIWFVAKFFVCFFSVLLVMVGQSLAVVLFLFGFMIVLWYSFLALSSIYYLVCKWIVFIVGKRIRNFG